MLTQTKPNDPRPTGANFFSSGLRQKVDQLMNILWAGGVNNPMDSIEQTSDVANSNGQITTIRRPIQRKGLLKAGCGLQEHWSLPLRQTSARPRFLLSQLAFQTAWLVSFPARKF